MTMKLLVKVKDEDNVAVAVEEIRAGTQIEAQLQARDTIPQAHKIALADIPKDAAVIRYGVVIGYALADIPKGAWIHEPLPFILCFYILLLPP